MKKLLFFLLTAVALTGCHFKRQEADLVIHNATIYTVNQKFEVEQAMAIRDGRIVAVGKERDILNNFRYKEAIDARQQFIYPGFIEGHCHFLGLGLTMQRVDLTGCRSFTEVLTRLCEFHAKNPGIPWITGRGWDHTLWPEAAWPARDSLDILFPDVPVLIQRIDGHAALANQKALDIAGFTIKTVIPGGVLMHAGGKLTGLLKENAVDSLQQFIPQSDAAATGKALMDAQKKCFSAGLTTVCDAGLPLPTIQLIDSLQKKGQLRMRIYAMITPSPESMAYYMKNGPYRTDYLNVRSFKFYADGSLGSRSACMLSPYADSPGEYGVMTIRPEELRGYLKQLYAKGFQANTHCIGDSANRTVLRLYNEILGGTNDRRWRIEHAQVVHPDDYSYFREANILPSVQSTHATSDMRWAGDRLGNERLRHAYAYRQLLGQNGIIILGTDFPVEDIYPLQTFYAAVFRKNAQGEPIGGFLPENAVSREDALRGMTIWAALGAFEEEIKGSLEPGKVADFVILDRDLLKVPEKDLLKTQVISTYIAGKKVY